MRVLRMHIARLGVFYFDINLLVYTTALIIKLDSVKTRVSNSAFPCYVILHEQKCSHSSKFWNIAVFLAQVRW